MRLTDARLTRVFINHKKANSLHKKSLLHRATRLIARIVIQLKWIRLDSQTAAPMCLHPFDDSLSFCRVASRLVSCRLISPRLVSFSFVLSPLVSSRRVSPRLHSSSDLNATGVRGDVSSLSPMRLHSFHRMAAGLLANVVADNVPVSVVKGHTSFLFRADSAHHRSDHLGSKGSHRPLR